MKLLAPLPLVGLSNINLAGMITGQKQGLSNAAGCFVGSFPVPVGIPSGLHSYAEGFGFNGIAGNLLSSTQGLDVTIQ